MNKIFSSAIILLIILLSSFSFLIPPINAVSCNQVSYVIPLYSYPTSGTWTTLIADHNANPSVPVTAIANVNSGPGTSSNPDYVTGINLLKAAGITVLGYVDTNYTVRSEAAVETDMDRWVGFYHVNGIFLDRMKNTAGGESYYSDVTTYAKGTDLLNPIFGNPGAPTIASYIGTVDVIISYENTPLPTAATVHTNTLGTGGVRAQWGIIAFSVSSAPTSAYISSISGNMTWLFVTNRTGPPSNPYDHLPAYESTELANMASAYSSCTTTTITTTVVGWNVPDTTHLNYAIFPLIIPLVVAGLFVGLALTFKAKGDYVVTLFLIGLFIGSLFSSFTVGGTSGTVANITLAQIVIVGTLLGLWLWQSSSVGAYNAK